MAGGSSHYGRVEISVGNEWGTVCDQYWDRREAKVFCRQLNFTDGEAIGGAHFGKGKGRIWISHLECKGTEERLHQCPHRGFANEYSFDWWFPLPCETHNDDAGVFCYKSGKYFSSVDKRTRHIMKKQTQDFKKMYSFVNLFKLKKISVFLHC